MDNNAIRQDRPLKFVFMCVKFIFYIANTTLVILEPPEYCSVSSYSLFQHINPVWLNISNLLQMEDFFFCEGFR